MLLSGSAFFTIKDTQNVFGVVGHHAEKCNDSHPEYRAGTACHNGPCHTYDVAGTNSSYQSSTKRLKLGNGFILCVSGYVLIPKNRADGFFHSVSDMRNLEK